MDGKVRRGALFFLMLFLREEGREESGRNRMTSQVCHGRIRSDRAGDQWALQSNLICLAVVNKRE